MIDNDETSELDFKYDLLFTEAVNFIDYVSLNQVTHGQLKKVWRAFQNNIERIRAMSYAPQSTVAATVWHMIPFSQAVFNVLGKPVMEDCEVDANKQAIADAYRLLENPNKFFEGKTYMRDVCVQDAHVYDKYNNVNVGLVRPGFVALLGAQIIGAWTALETLLIDLWVEAVTINPRHLLHAIGQKKIEVKDLFEFEEYLQGRIGELFRTRMGFDSFKEVVRTYTRAFSGDAEIASALTVPLVQMAHLIRNLLVHDAGLVTTTFRSEASSLAISPWNAVDIKASLPLDGKNVAELTSAIVTCANTLILSVDRWCQRPSGAGQT